MNIKQLVTMKIKTLLSIVDNKVIVSDEICKELNKIVLKTKHLEYFINDVTIIIIINNINKANIHFNANDILDIKNPEYLYIVYLICMLNPMYMDKEVDVLFIENKNYDKPIQKLYDYIIDYPRYIIAKDNTHENFEKLFKNKSDYVKNARKSIINSIFGKDRRVSYRNFNNVITKPNLNHQLKDKYINLACPICYKKYEVTNETINSIIKVDKRLKRIVFECLHKDKGIVSGKGYLKFDDYTNYISIKDETYVIQMWLIDNYKRLMNVFKN